MPITWMETWHVMPALPFGFHGIIYRQWSCSQHAVRQWTCSHRHVTEENALRCAKSERDRRKSQTEEEKMSS